jgi:hypothetical protein
MVESGEWLCSHVLKNVPHRHFIFSLPKILRRYFLYDRNLLCRLLGFETIQGNWGFFSSQEKASDSG